MIAGAIEPGLIVQAGDGDDERIAFPLAHRLPHPRIHRRGTGIGHVDVAHGARIFVREEDRLVALQDLKRERHVVGARHAGQVALDLRIGVEPALLVLLLLRGGFRQVRNLVAFDHADAAGHRADRAEREHGGRRHRHDGPRPKRQRGLRVVRADVVIRGVEGLPDAVEVGLAVGGARRTRGLPGGRFGRPEAGSDNGGCRQSNRDVSQGSALDQLHLRGCGDHATVS